MKHLALKAAIAVVALLMIVGGVSAQSAALTYGASSVGELTDASPLALYTFSGTAGDLVTAQVIPITPGLEPSLSLLAPSQQQLANSDSDVTMPGSANARLSYRLPDSGVYTLFVGASVPIVGQFLINLSGQAPSVSAALIAETVTQLNIPLGAPSQTYSFMLSPDSITTLSASTDTPGFAFTIDVRDSNGQSVAFLSNGVQSALLSFAPSDAALYEVKVTAASADQTGAVSLLVSGSGAGATTPPPAATEEATTNQGVDPLAGIGPSDACTVSPRNNANLRSGPGTNFDIAGQLIGGQLANPSGQASGADGFIWYQLPAGPWVRSDVVASAGACISLPTVQVTTAPPPPTTTEEAPTGETGENTENNNTGEENNTGVQTAPPDTNQYILNVDRDENTQFSEVVSYPDGDTVDLISVNIDGLSNQPPNNTREFSFTLVCTGTGTENVRWGTGQSGGLTCGGTITRLFTNDSDSVLLNVRIESGGPSYVPYTIVINKIS